MEGKSNTNGREGKETPPGNYTGRRTRLQHDCTVKLFPPISIPAVPGALPGRNLEAAATATDREASSLTTVATSRNSNRPETGCSCCCHCSCKRSGKKKKRCESRMPGAGSALSSCSGRSSSLSSWSSCSSRSSASSTSSSLGGRDTSSPRTVSRSMEVKDALKRIAEELASNDYIPAGNFDAAMNSRGDPFAPPPSRVLTGVSPPINVTVKQNWTINTLGIHSCVPQKINAFVQHLLTAIFRWLTARKYIVHVIVTLWPDFKWEPFASIVVPLSLCVCVCVYAYEKRL